MYASHDLLKAERGFPILISSGFFPQMPSHFFKLSDSSSPRTNGIAQTPEWLEKHLSTVNSEYDALTLGQVDTSLIKGEPVNYSAYPSALHNSVDTSAYPYASNQPTRTVWPARKQLNQKFWENTEDGFDNGFSSKTKNSIPDKVAINPKNFCDNIYMRLMNVFFVITDEKQASSTQQRITNVVNEMENEFIKK